MSYNTTPESPYSFIYVDTHDKRDVHSFVTNTIQSENKVSMEEKKTIAWNINARLS